MQLYMSPYIDVVDMSLWRRICGDSSSGMDFVIDDGNAGGGYSYGEGEGGADLSL